MKKRIFSLIALISYILCLCFPPPIQRTAFASDETYACITTSTTYFYATKQENSGLFLLPKTYFVKVLSKETDFCRIEYLYDSDYTKKLTGYAKTSELTFVDFTPQTPYLYHVFDLRYTVDGSYIEGDAFLDQITVSCAYYGDYHVGSKPYCYVLRGSSFGYVPKPEGLVYPQNYEYEEYLSKVERGEITPPTSDEEGMSAAQIAILITLCLLIPLLAALIIKTSKKSTYDFDDKDD